MAILSDVIKANRATLSDPVLTKSGSISIYEADEPLFWIFDLADAAITRVALAVGVINPFRDQPDKEDSDEEDSDEDREEEENKYKHLATTYVPQLEPKISFALRSVGANRFASAWLQVKEKAQTGRCCQSDLKQFCCSIKTLSNLDKALESNDLCDLPLSIGPCKSFVGRFFYNTDSGDCQPFGFGGCEGNGNKFTSLLHCSE
jgi:hypothetical protein